MSDPYAYKLKTKALSKSNAKLRHALILTVEASNADLDLAQDSLDIANRELRRKDKAITECQDALEMAVATFDEVFDGLGDEYPKLRGLIVLAKNKATYALGINKQELPF